jgi:hypothetical protein
MRFITLARNRSSVCAYWKSLGSTDTNQAPGTDPAVCHSGIGHGVERLIGQIIAEMKSKTIGGEGEIRTPGTRKGSTVFETAAIDHSATSP